MVVESHVRSRSGHGFTSIRSPRDKSISQVDQASTSVARRLAATQSWLSSAQCPGRGSRLIPVGGTKGLATIELVTRRTNLTAILPRGNVQQASQFSQTGLDSLILPIGGGALSQVCKYCVERHRGAHPAPAERRLSGEASSRLLSPLGCADPGSDWSESRRAGTERKADVETNRD